MLGLVLLADMGDNLPDFMLSKSRLGDVLLYYVNFLAFNLPGVLPLSFLLSLLISLGRLHKNLEITAMRAAGVSLFRITRPLLLAATGLALLLSGLVTTWGPEANDRMKLFLDSVEVRKALVASGSKTVADANVEESFPLSALVHVDRQTGQIWFVDRLNVATRKARGVTVHFLDESGREKARLVAGQGEYREGKWIVREGRLLKFADGGENVWFSRVFSQPSVDAEKARFELKLALPSQKTPLLDALAFNEEVLALAGQMSVTPEKLRSDYGAKRMSDLSFTQIRQSLPLLEADKNPKLAAYETRYHQLLSSPLLCLLLLGIAAPLSCTGVRVNPMLGTGKAVGWFALHFVVSGLFSTLGENKILPPLVAAWLPLGLLGGVVLILWRRAR